MTTLDPTATADLTPYKGSWKLDAAATTVAFRTKAMWVMPVTGHARALEGAGTMSDDGVIEGQIVVDMTSVTTGMKKRDAHLQSADFFNTAAHPTMTFDLSRAVATTPGHATLSGTLTLAGRSKPVTVDATIAADGTGVVVTGSIADLDRSDWGMSWSKMGASLHTRVDVMARFRKA